MTEKNQKIHKLKILIITSNRGFCFFYRLKWPLQVLHDCGLADVVAVDPDRQPHSMIAEWATWADVIVFHFGVPAEILLRYSDYIKECKLPKLIVCEFDDDYAAIHPSNFAYKYFGIKEVPLKNGEYMWKDGQRMNDESEEIVFSIEENKARLEKMYKAIIASDIITCTQGHLAKTFERYNPNVEVLPNYINPEAMTKPYSEKKNKKITIGWQGGDSHHQDLKMIMPALKSIKEMYGKKVQFKFMGADFKKMFAEVDGQHIPWVKPDYFYTAFSENLFDIGIIPLIDNKFNRSKSNIKWLEYSHYRIPSVVSKVSPYKEGILHGTTGFLYSNNQELFSQLTDLIDDPVLRITTAAAAKKHVDANYDIKQNAYKWYNLYMRGLSEKIKYLRDCKA